MKLEAFSRKRGWCLLRTVLVCLLVTASLGCNGDGSAGAAGVVCLTGDPGRADRIQGAKDRVERTLVVNEDGTVSIGQQDPDFELLQPGDEAFGQALLDLLNAKVRRGECQVNSDLSVECPVLPTSASCTKHWWGECCFQNASTTTDVCIALEAGEGALAICGLIPVADAICAVISVVGTIPLELEICPCSDQGESSTLHVTWLDVVWFKCGTVSC